MTEKNSNEPNEYDQLFKIINQDQNIESISKEEEKPLDYKDIAKISFSLGIISIGGLEEHINLIKNQFVVNNNNIKEDNFNNILELCCLLPGYSSPNLLATLCTIFSKSIVGGMISLFCYNLPSLLCILVSSFIINLIKYNVRPRVSNYNPDAKYFNLHDEALLFSLMVLAAGLTQAALALLINSTIHFTKKLSNTVFHLTLSAISTGIYYFAGSYYLLVILMIICGFSSIMKGDHDYLFPISSNNDNIGQIKFTGLVCLISFFVFFILIWIINYIFNNIYTFLAESFLRIGALSIGEGNLIVPLIFVEYSEMMEESEVINGYALVRLLPGSVLNIAAYTGVMISNILSGIICGLMIYIPGFLFMLGVLPYLNSIKSSTKFQYFIRGANSAAAGFIFACTIKLWVDSCFVNKYTNEVVGTLNILFCLFLCENYSIHKTIILICGAVINLGEQIIYYIIRSKSLKFRWY